MDKETIKKAIVDGGIYGQILSVNRTGTSRNIAILVISDNTICDISYDVAKLIGYPLTKNNEIRVRGCGFCPINAVSGKLQNALRVKGCFEWRIK